MTLPGLEEATTHNSHLDAGPGLADEEEFAVSLDLRTPSVAESDAPYCFQCGVQMQRAGSCHACPSCGTTSGCS